MSLRVIVGRWHGGQLVIACIASLFAACCVLAVGFWGYALVQSADSNAVAAAHVGWFDRPWALSTVTTYDVKPKIDQLRTYRVSQVGLVAYVNQVADSLSPEDHVSMLRYAGMPSDSARAVVAPRFRQEELRQERERGISARYDMSRHAIVALSWVLGLAGVSLPFVLCWIWLGERARRELSA